ncbi:MAG: hypothetical protein ACRCZW_01580 [Lactobacillaceae bacterium]
MKVEISYEGVVQYMKCSRRPFLEDVFCLSKTSSKNDFEKWIISMIPANYDYKVINTRFSKEVRINKHTDCKDIEVMDILFYSGSVYGGTYGEGASISGTIYTEGEKIKVSEGDYIVKDINGNFCLYKPNDFKHIYELIDENESNPRRKKEEKKQKKDEQK